jgi:uncharacterized protein (DUF2147 family)
MLSSFLAAAAVLAGSLQGVWATPVDKSRVRIEACGPNLCGYVVTSTRLVAEPDQRDVRNPDPALRGRAVRNLKMLEVRPATSPDWRGWIYDPKSGHTFRLTGCLIAFLCGSQTWDRGA